MKLPCKKCGRVDEKTLVEESLCDTCYWIDKYKDLEKENKFLKKVIKASVTMNMHYRIGKPTMPEWVLDTLMEAREKYGDLHKIK